MHERKAARPSDPAAGSEAANHYNHYREFDELGRFACSQSSGTSVITPFSYPASLHRLRSEVAHFFRFRYEPSERASTASLGRSTVGLHRVYIVLQNNGWYDAGGSQVTDETLRRRSFIILESVG